MGCGNSTPTVENKEKIILNLLNTPFNSNLILHDNSKIDNIFIKMNSYLKEIETLRVFYIDSLDPIIMDSLQFFYKDISISKIFECILIHVSVHLNKEIDTNIIQLREDIFHLNKNPLKLNDKFNNSLLDRFFDYFEIVKTLSSQIDIDNLFKQLRDSQKMYELEYNNLSKSDKESNSKVFRANIEVIKYGLKLLREIENYFSSIVDFKVQIKNGVDKVVNFEFINKVFNEIKSKNLSSSNSENDVIQKILWDNIKENDKIKCDNHKECFIIANKMREIKKEKKS